MIDRGGLSFRVSTPVEVVQSRPPCVSLEASNPCVVVRVQLNRHRRGAGRKQAGDQTVDLCGLENSGDQQDVDPGLGSVAGHST